MVLSSGSSGHGPQVMVLRSWSSGHGPQVMVLSSWSSGHGPQFMVFRSWSSGHGPKVMVLRSWSSGPGPQVMVLRSWSSSHGPQVMVLGSWSSGPGSGSGWKTSTVSSTQNLVECVLCRDVQAIPCPSPPPHFCTPYFCHSRTASTEMNSGLDAETTGPFRIIRHALFANEKVQLYECRIMTLINTHTHTHTQVQTCSKKVELCKSRITDIRIFRNGPVPPLRRLQCGAPRLSPCRSQVRKTRNVDVHVNVHVEIHPVGTNTPQNTNTNFKFKVQKKKKYPASCYQSKKQQILLKYFLLVPS